jgi:hypothetical protein
MTTKAEDRPVDAPQAEEQKQEPSFPTLGSDMNGTFHLDKATRTFWVGFKLDAFDYNGALHFLDAMKLHVWELYIQIAKQRQVREQLAGKPKSEGIAAMAKRLVGLK